MLVSVYSQAQNGFELMLEDVEVAENTDAKIPCSYVATGELVTGEFLVCFFCLHFVFSAEVNN